MQEILLRSLIAKDYFKVLTEVKVRHKVLTVGHVSHVKVEDIFTITNIRERPNGTLVMEGLSTTAGDRIKFSCDDIVAIDGMTPERFAENYMIATDGTEIKVKGARRGRRPKNWVPVEALD